jgi:zinc resistance-associated protein
MRAIMRTKVFIATAVIAVAGSTLVYAQQSGAPSRPGAERSERFRPTAEDFSAFTDARVAAMKAGLRLTAEQEKSWPAFEEAYRNLAKMRTDRILAFRDGPPPPPADMLEGLQQRADALGRRAAALRQIADATAPLYKSLDEAQKRRFAVLAPMLRQPPGQPNFRRGEWRGQGDSRRDGQRGMDQPRSGSPRGGAMERIHFERHEIEHDDSSGPGMGVARENGWR